MTIHLTALSNDQARLIHFTLTTNDPVAAAFVADHWEDLGFIVVRREEL